jgi:hypothetical protein
MLTTYKAILRGDRLEWSDEVPVSAANDTPITVHVTILDDTNMLAQKRLRGQHMADILAQLASKRTLNSINDPATWERDVRSDRSLPDRA